MLVRTAEEALGRSERDDSIHVDVPARSPPGNGDRQYSVWPARPPVWPTLLPTLTVWRELHPPRPALCPRCTLSWTSSFSLMYYLGHVQFALRAYHILLHGLIHPRASLVAQLLKNPPAVQETWVWSLGWEEPMEKGKATHSSILAWRIPWTV